jgi:tetratricopeptide (TPR) repeat protein
MSPALRAQFDAACALEDAGDLPGALEAFERSAQAAAVESAPQAEAVALRYAAVVCHRRGDFQRAEARLAAAVAGARALHDTRLLAETLNTAGVFALERGQARVAREHLLDARALSAGHQALRARIEQNLGALASMQGDDAGVVAHSRAAVEAFEACGDEQGCAKVYHNLGMRCADRGEWEQADAHYRRALDIARRIGDTHLQGLCLLNLATAAQAAGRPAEALSLAESALEHFERLGTPADQADARRAMGSVLRAQGRSDEARRRLLEGLDLAAQARAPLIEAEIYEELGLVEEAEGAVADSAAAFRRAADMFVWLEVPGASERVAAHLSRVGARVSTETRAAVS